MRDNTAVDEVSSTTPSSAMTEKDEAAKRCSTMTKVCERLAEVSTRLDAIDTAVKGVLADIIAAHPLGEAVDILVAFDNEVIKLTERGKELAGRVAYAKEVSMPARMDEEQCKTFNTETARITRTARVFASMLDQEAGFAWLRENNYEALIKETVNASSLSGAAKELMENGIELPEEIFKTVTKDSVSITRKKP